MPSEYYPRTSYPQTGDLALASLMRAELNLIDQAFLKLPTLAGRAGRVPFVNSSGTGLSSDSPITVLATGGPSASVNFGGAATVMGVLGVGTASSSTIGFGVPFTSMYHDATTARWTFANTDWIGFGRSTDTFELVIGNAARMLVNSAGNVAFNGTPDAAIRMMVNGLGGDGTGVQIGDIVGGITFAHSASTSTATIAHGSASSLRFGTQTGPGLGGFVERMRIDSSGAVLVNANAPLSAGYQFQVGATGNAVLFRTTSATNTPSGFWNATTSGDGLFCSFFTESGGGVQRGSIDFNRAGVAVRYNTTSDARLKKDVKDAAPASALIDEIRVRSFTWKETGHRVDHGFIAQELQEVVPDAVSVGSEDRSWAVDYSKLVPLLVREVQSLRQRLQVLESA